MRIDDAALRPEANNVTLVRLVLASSVIVTHCYGLIHRVEGNDPFSAWLGVPLSAYAVDGFFFMSGFLVYRSLVRRGHTGAFLVARLARLWPALAVAVLGTVAVGLAVTSVPAADYFEGPTARFIAGNLSLLFGSYTLTGVNCGAGLCNVNGSLWTLPWEARCYALLAVLSLLGLVGRRAMVGFVLPASLAFALLWHLPPLQAAVRDVAGGGAVFLLDVFDRLWTLFALGIAASLWRERIPLSWSLLAALFVLNLAAQATGLGLHARAVFIGYAVLCASFLSARRGAISARWPDYSYGMYIYAFPTMIAIAAVWRPENYLALAAANLLATVPLAALSWHFVEKPVLELVRRRSLARRAQRAELQAA